MSYQLVSCSRLLSVFFKCLDEDELCEMRRAGKVGWVPTAREVDVYAADNAAHHLQAHIQEVYLSPVLRITAPEAVKGTLDLLEHLIGLVVQCLGYVLDHGHNKSPLGVIGSDTVQKRVLRRQELVVALALADRSRQKGRPDTTGAEG